jgi:hypothetical protein
VRGALRKGGLVIRDEARRLTPVLQKPDTRRKAGVVRRAISVRPSKFARQAGNEGVFIGVRPLTRARIAKFKRAQAAKGQRGTNNPNDPFYWRFVHFRRQAGRRVIEGAEFLTKAAKSKGAEAIRTFLREAVPLIQKFNTKARR